MANVTTLKYVVHACSRQVLTYVRNWVITINSSIEDFIRGHAVQTYFAK